MGKGPPPGGYGKPNVAPKPPSVRPAVPTKKSTLTVSSTNLVTSVDGRNQVTRAHSMRIPRTPPVAPNMQRMFSCFSIFFFLTISYPTSYNLYIIID